MIPHRQQQYWDSLSRDEIIQCIESDNSSRDCLPDRSEAIELLINRFDDYKTASFLFEHCSKSAFTTHYSHSLVPQYLAKYIRINGDLKEQAFNFLKAVFHKNSNLLGNAYDACHLIQALLEIETDEQIGDLIVTFLNTEYSFSGEDQDDDRRELAFDLLRLSRLYTKHFTHRDNWWKTIHPQIKNERYCYWPHDSIWKVCAHQLSSKPFIEDFLWSSLDKINDPWNLLYAIDSLSTMEMTSHRKVRFLDVLSKHSDCTVINRSLIELIVQNPNEPQFMDLLAQKFEDIKDIVFRVFIMNMLSSIPDRKKHFSEKLQTLAIGEDQSYQRDGPFPLSSTKSSAIKAYAEFASEAEFLKLANLVVEQDISCTVKEALVKGCLNYSPVSDGMCKLLKRLFPSGPSNQSVVFTRFYMDLLDKEPAIVQLVIDLIENGLIDNDLFSFSKLAVNQQIAVALIERSDLVQTSNVNNIYRNIILNVPSLDFETFIPNWIARCEFDFQKSDIISTFPILLHSGELSEEFAEQYSR